MFFAILKLRRYNPRPVLKEVRDYKNLDTTDFQKAFEQVPWWISNVFDELDDVTYCFQSFYNDIINEKIKTRKAKVRTKSLPWVNSQVRKTMNKRYKALLDWQKDKTNFTLKRRYQQLRNQAKKELRIAETTYWKDQFKKANTRKDFWKLVNKVKRKEKDCRIGALLDSEGKLITEDKEKAEFMNTYFTTIGQTLAENMEPNMTTNYNEYIYRVTPKCQHLEMDEEHFEKQFKGLKENKATGHDNVAGEAIKPGSL